MLISEQLEELQNTVKVVSSFIQLIKETFVHNKTMMKTVDEIQTRINREVTE